MNLQKLQATLRGIKQPIVDCYISEYKLLHLKHSNGKETIIDINNDCIFSGGNSLYECLVHTMKGD